MPPELSPLRAESSAAILRNLPRICERTGGTKSLRDALRFLVAWTADHHRAFQEDELTRLIREATGVDVSDIFAQCSR
jgi:predicted metalloprotease with PDZ domain